MSELSKAGMQLFSLLAKDFNSYHDARGRFTNGSGATSFTTQTKDPSKQHWANAAIEREKAKATGGGTNGNGASAYIEARQKVKELRAEKTQAWEEANNHIDAAIEASKTGNSEKANAEYEKYEENHDRWKSLDSEIKEVEKGAGVKSAVEQDAFRSDIEYKQAQSLDEPLSGEEIIDKLGGGDKTKGSCSSLAFAYAANENGLDVTDYRGGESQDFFSRGRNIYRIAELDGVQSNMAEHTNDYKSAAQVLSNVQSGKNYYFAVAKHAAVVRKSSSGSIEYLELQSGYNIDGHKNGWYPLTNAKLRSRFGAQKSHTSAGRKVARKSVLIDISTLKGNSEFERLMGYVNTSPDKQQKGAAGYAK